MPGGQVKMYKLARRVWKHLKTCLKSKYKFKNLPDEKVQIYKLAQGKNKNLKTCHKSKWNLKNLLAQQVKWKVKL